MFRPRGRLVLYKVAMKEREKRERGLDRMQDVTLEHPTDTKIREGGLGKKRKTSRVKCPVIG